MARNLASALARHKRRPVESQCETIVAPLDRKMGYKIGLTGHVTCCHCVTRGWLKSRPGERSPMLGKMLTAQRQSGINFVSTPQGVVSEKFPATTPSGSCGLAVIFRWTTSG
jgi:hypothetical protein